MPRKIHVVLFAVIALSLFACASMEGRLAVPAQHPEELVPRRPDLHRVSRCTERRFHLRAVQPRGVLAEHASVCRVPEPVRMQHVPSGELPHRLPRHHGGTETIGQEPDRDLPEVAPPRRLPLTASHRRADRSHVLLPLPRESEIVEDLRSLPRVGASWTGGATHDESMESDGLFPARSLPRGLFEPGCAGRRSPPRGLGPYRWLHGG